MMTIPNILTTFRLIAALMILIVFVILPRPYSDWTALCLFVLASLTDYLDGYLARKLKQVSEIGKMLDPIADKALVVVCLALLLGLFSLRTAIVIPVALILFREVFVSGIREYLGQAAGALAVTKLAKWKTATQMVAIGVLLTHGLFEHYFFMHSIGMDHTIVQDILAGREEDLFNLKQRYIGTIWSMKIGVWLLWLAATITVITGFDYFVKSLALLKERG